MPSSVAATAAKLYENAHHAISFLFAPRTDFVSVNSNSFVYNRKRSINTHDCNDVCSGFGAVHVVLDRYISTNTYIYSV